MLGEINLNFSTAASTIIVINHVFVQFGNRVIVSFCTDIKHESELRFEVFAYSLEEPFVRVDLTIISLFQSEDEIDSSAF